MPAVNVLDAIRALAPGLVARGEEIELARKLPPDIAADLARAGLFKLCVPAAYGGGEASPRVLLEAIEAVAQADGSAGWCVMIGATSGASAAYLEPAVAREIHGDPMSVTGGIFAPRGRAVRDGAGYRVDGRWQWASGSGHCRWMKGGCVVIDDGKPRMIRDGVPDSRMVYMPADRIEFLDTWFSSGLKGTGSCDMQVRDLFVPAERTVSIVTDRPRVDGALYRFPIFGLLAMGCAAVALGIARGAIEDLRDLAGAKTPTGSRRPLAERAMAQVDAARAEATLSSARAWLLEAIAEAETAAAAGEIPVALRARLRLAATHATDSAAKAVDLMYTLGGGTSVYCESPLQRRFRDVHVVTQHMMVGASTYELAGRVLLGVPTDPSMM